MKRRVKKKCDLCGSDKSKFLFNKEGKMFVECINCSLAFIDENFKQSELEQKYNQGEMSPVDYYKKTISVDKRTFGQRLALIEKYVKKGNLLDVGCSIGTFMEVARKKQWNVMGIDLNKDAINDCKKKDLSVVLKDINLYKSKKKFDLINMSDLIEHVASPTKTLEICRGLLVEGGHIFISTPDFGSMLAKIMKNKWFHIWPKEHLYYFNKKTIRKLLEKTGYEVIFVKNSQRFRDVNAITRHIRILRPFEPIIRKIIGRGIKLYLNDELIALARKSEK